MKQRYQWYSDHTYAQHGDDLIIINIFYAAGNKKPSYLDIGAHHPRELSNTALLYEIGCRGINVEANPRLIDAFRRERPEDINLQACVGPKSGTEIFYCDAANGSLVKEVAQGFFGIRSEVTVHVTTIEAIVAEHAGGQYPDLLTIDIEGSDFDVLSTIDYEKSSPKVICAEIVSWIPGSAKIPDLLRINGYTAYFHAGSNFIFVRNDVVPLLMRF